MQFEKFVGKTIGQLAKETSIFSKPVRVFILANANDTTGKHLMDAYTLRQIVIAHPNAAEAVVKHAINYNGEAVLRVWMPA